MKKFLIPVDFSEFSENACQYGLRLAATMGAEIKLFHAFLDPIMDSPVPMYDFGGYERVHNEMLSDAEEQEKQMLEQLNERLKRQITQARLENVILSDAAYQRGFPDEEIIAIAEQYQPDLIIVGTKGKSGIMKGIFGSVTEEIIEKSTIPVLVVPNIRIPVPGGKIMYATNYNDADLRAIHKLIELLVNLNTKLYFVHICFGSMDREDKENMVRIKTFVEKECPNQSIVFDIVESENIFEGFDEYINDNQIDIIAVTTHRRSFFTKYFNPSFTKRLLNHTKVPMLVFH